MSLWKYFAGVLLIFATKKVLEFRANARTLSYLPGLRSVFSPASLFGTLIPTYFWNPGLSWQWRWRNEVYSKYGVQTMSVLSYLSGHSTVYTSSMKVARQFLAVKGQFVKPEEMSLLMLLWGRNLFTENGSEWSRHRRIMNPAFTPETNALVWEEAASVYQEMLQGEGWLNEKDNTIFINNITTKFALIVIARCGFGQPISWNTPHQTSGMPLEEALSIVSESSIARLVIPRWMYKLPIKRFRDIETAYTDLAGLMKTLIESRREELATEDTGDANTRKDVFRLMIRASEGEEKLRMADSELTGNTFLMLFAGHETTAKTLDAAIGFLALYEDIQEEVYQEIRAVKLTDGKVHFKDYQRLVKVQSCFVEAARLFPAGFLTFRETTETVIVQTDEEDGHGGQIILPAGTRVAVDMVGLHYNPMNFSDPEEFRPSRWYEASENDMTMFSMGPRACVGRKFALTEGTAFLTNLLRDYQLHIILNPGETRAEWRRRVMKAVSAMTLGVGKVPVHLTRR